MGRRGQDVYVTLRRLLIDSPVLTGAELLTKRNAFSDLPAWSDWLSDAYETVTADDIVDGSVGECSQCKHLVRHTGRIGFEPDTVGIGCRLRHRMRNAYFGSRRR